MKPHGYRSTYKEISLIVAIIITLLALILILIGACLAYTPAVSAASTLPFTSTDNLFTKTNCDRVLTKPNYKICYSYKYKGALFTSYILSSKTVNSKNIKKRPGFYSDKELPIEYRTYTSNYTRNKYKADRGHLTPDASFDWSKDSLYSVYSMANIIPQYYRTNRYTWSKAEREERKVTMKYGSALVINGVVYQSSYRPIVEYMVDSKTQSKIAYPISYWKLIQGEDQSPVCYSFGNFKEDYKSRSKLSRFIVDCSSLNILLNKSSTPAVK